MKARYIVLYSHRERNWQVVDQRERVIVSKHSTHKEANAKVAALNA